MQAFDYIAAFRAYLDYLERHITFVKEAWELVQVACIDMEFMGDKTLHGWIEKEIYMHDISKFSDDEFGPYRRRFYPANEVEKILPHNMVDMAISHHIRINDHHIENWTKARYTFEKEWMVHCVHMLVDWIAMDLGSEKNIDAREFFQRMQKEHQLTEEVVNFIQDVLDRVYKHRRV